MDKLSLQLLGGFAVHRSDQPIDLPPACQRLVALAALKRRPVHRLWVCATLWPHAQTRRAIASLRSAMWRLRPLGAEPLLRVDPQYIALSPDVSVDWYDALGLIEQLTDGGSIDAQLVADLLPALRAGELLDRWTERWVVGDRDRYHEMRMRAVETLGHKAEGPAPHYNRRPVHARRAVQSTRNDSPGTGAS